MAGGIARWAALNPNTESENADETVTPQKAPGAKVRSDYHWLAHASAA